MANPKLLVEVVGDSRQLTKTLRRTETETQLWARKMQTVTSTAGIGTGGLLGLGKGGAFVAGAGAGLLALKSVTDAAKNSQVILGQTSVAVEDAGLSWQQYAKQVESASLRISNASAFDDEAVLQSFSVFVRGQKDVAKSIQLTQLAADVARGRYTDLASATQIVNKAAFGQIGALRRAGIQIDKNATSVQALAALQSAYGGAAVRYANSAAGAQDKFAVSVENLRESIGAGLLPVLTKVVDQANEFVQAANKLGSGFAIVGDKGEEVGKKVGVTHKLLVRLFYLNPTNGPLFGGVRELNDLLDGTKKNIAGVKDAAAGLQGPIGAAGAGLLGPLPPPKPTVKGATAEQRNRWFDTDITRRLDKVQDIGTIKGQIASLTEIAALIQKRIAVTKDITRKLSLEDQLRTVNRQKNSLGDQLVADAAEAKRQAKALEAERETARKLREQQQREAALAARTARQFRELGLDATGETVTPGVENLKKRVGSITDRITGTKFDTPALHAQLARFRKVLSEGLVPKDVRAKIKQMLDDINQELVQNTKQGGPLTKTTSINSDKTLAGLGLTPEQLRAARQRLSQFNSGGVGIAAGNGAAGALGVATPTIVVQSDVYLDGEKISTSTRRHNTVHARRNPKQKRGRKF